MRLLLTIIFLLPITGYTCVSLQQDSIKLEWTGYKTATKAGVHGTFDSITYKGKTQAKDVNDLLAGASLNIDLMTPNSGNAGRDTNMKKSFFKMISGKTTATVKSVEHGYARVNLKMGNKTVEVALKPELKDNVLELDGTLDLYDFALNKALASLTKQCMAMHEGKTWNDVGLKLTANVTPCKAK